MASDFEFLKSTISDIIWKEREKIESDVSASDNPSLDKACHIWFMQKHSKGTHVLGPLLQENALLLFPTLYPDMHQQVLKASSGWLYSFCIRHGIRGISLKVELLSAETSAVRAFRSQLLEMM